MINQYGFKKISIRNIREITGEKISLGEDPNKFNIIFYQVDKDYKISYFDTDQQIIIELMHLPNVRGVGARSAKNKLTKALVKNNCWEYLKHIHHVEHFEGGFRLISKYGTDEVNLVYDGVTLTIE